MAKPKARIFHHSILDVFRDEDRMRQDDRMNQDVARSPDGPEVTIHQFADDGSIPNNPAVPLLIYKKVLDLTSADVTVTCIERFAAHGWHGAWRNGIFPFPHYHSSAHEVLGICQGQAKVRLGGESGLVITAERGDALVLPAGTGHQNLGSSPDLLVVGAYPNGMDWDLCRGEPSKRDEERRNIQGVPIPDCDPLFGHNGPLMRLWQLST